MNLINHFFSEKIFPLTAIIFYSVGIALFVVPSTFGIFLYITPWIILLNMVLILIKHKQWDIKTILVLSSVYILSFLLEMRGTSDSRIFGSYFYLDTLGVKFNQTPLLIGVNWLMLIYGSNAIGNKLFRKPIPAIFAASLLMVIYDILIEFLAPVMAMWQFDQTYPPLRNFIVWFLTAFFFHSLFAVFKINTKNKYAIVLFIAQIGFFALIKLYLVLK